MRKESLAFLKALIQIPSPSGFEEKAQQLVRRHLRKYCDTVETDVHGNVIGVRNPKGKVRVMLAGHVDEIGFMVKHIAENGYIYFSPIGGVDTGLVAGQRVVIHGARGPVAGVVGKKAIHLLESEERKKVPKWKDLWFDIGAKDRRTAESIVAVGDPATFEVGFQPLLGELVAARGFDDRVGSFVVVETMRLIASKKLNVAVYGVSTVQEEIGLRGARTSAFGIDPHAGIAIDVDHAVDFPGVDKKEFGEVDVGKGPMLYRGANINPHLGRRLIDTARKHKIPFQMHPAPTATGTDANVIQISRAGVAAALVSIPTRYIHTPAEVLSLADLENAVKLLAACLVEMPAIIKFIP